MIRKKALLIGGISAIAVLAGPAQAQIAAETDAGKTTVGAAPAPQDPNVGEIIVTANKREQNLNKVGLSITALGASDLAARRIANVADLALATPGLTFAPTPDNTPIYTLRGVGFFEYSLGAYPDVSLYLDQAPLPLPAMATLTAFDLERVEVLKGPQGTLFGNNATGGAINFVAAKPTKDFSGGVEIGYGRFNSLEVSGHVSGPLTDTLSARLAVKAAKGDDWQKSITRDDTIGKQDNIAARLIVDWEPTDRLKFSLNLNGWRDRSDPPSPQLIAFNPQGSTVGVPLFTSPIAPANARATDWGPGQRPYQDNRFKQATLRGDYDFGFASLTSVTGYSDYRMQASTDNDGSFYRDQQATRIDGRAKSFTQELRLSNGSRSGFRWVIGANYEHTTVYQETRVNFEEGTAAADLGIVRNVNISDSKMNNYAGFANAEYDVTDELTLKAGVRRTRATRDFFASNADSPDFVATPADIRPRVGTPAISLTDFLNAAFGAVYGNRPDGTRVVPLIQPFASFILDNRTNPDGTPVDPATYLTTGVVNNRLVEHNTAWSAGVDYKPSSSLLLYFNVSKGYKAGSFPHLSGSTALAYGAVKQESILDFEGGFKAQLFDRMLSVNGAAFYYDYRNKQLRGKFVDPLLGSLDRLINVTKSRITGGELDIQARPMRGLSLSASATYVKAEVIDYEGTVGQTTAPLPGGGSINVPILADFKGAQLPLSPKFQYSIRADYDFPLTTVLNGFVGAGVNGQTKSIGILTVDPAKEKLYEVNARALVSVNAGLRSADDTWRLTFWGKNIFNKYYWTSAIQAYDTDVRYAGRPAEYGASFAYKF